ncbi:CBO0543 family protein [Metabacillus niabensis]|uniref:CBO0543 family protein n=1 Tax=Metabacillus niabensis TaxID=324854 RepID=UPI001CFAB8B4|nr:CBO0543 family protein [Metabacillus niabensis]
MTYQEGLDQIDKATQKISDATQLTIEAVMNTFLFTWQWWIALAMLIVPWAIWAIFRDRENSARLFSAGLLVMVISEILDAIGVGLGNWAYPVKVIPIATISFSFRLSLLPVIFMLLLQFKPQINPFIKAVLYGGFGAFIGLPFLESINLYKKIDWQLIYSFFILTTLYLLGYWFSRRKSF